MNVLTHFTIPYKGMGDGIHNLDFDIDSDFFKAFEASHLDNGKFKVLVEIDRRHDSSVFTFNIDGSTKTNCDRCLESINLPMYGDFTLHVKHGADGESTDEIMYIHPETSTLNLSQVIYEFVLLCMPLVKIYNCENDEIPPCNINILDKLDDVEEKDKKEEKETTKNGIWDTLKGLELDK
ncbi:MAG: hypothetical protein ACI86M_000017 [Saprospiraceae bacterium]|jgi:uncharacterized metal-binding protein YceD (DUF177 family)